MLIYSDYNDLLAATRTVYHISNDQGTFVAFWSKYILSHFGLHLVHVASTVCM